MKGEVVAITYSHSQLIISYTLTKYDIEFETEWLPK